MADVCDLAGDLVDASTESLVRAAQQKAGKEYHPDFDGQTCVDCGEEIPWGRLILGRVRCVLCQGKLEYNRRA